MGRTFCDYGEFFGEVCFGASDVVESATCADTSTRGTSHEFLILDRSAAVIFGRLLGFSFPSGDPADSPTTASRYLQSSGRGIFCSLKVPRREVRWFSTRFREKIL